MVVGPSPGRLHPASECRYSTSLETRTAGEDFPLDTWWGAIAIVGVEWSIANPSGPAKWAVAQRGRSRGLRVRVQANRLAIGEAVAAAIEEVVGVPVIADTTDPTQPHRASRRPDVVVVVGSRRDGSTSAGVRMARRRWPQSLVIALPETDRVGEGVALVRQGADAGSRRTRGWRSAVPSRPDRGRRARAPRPRRPGVDRRDAQGIAERSRRCRAVRSPVASDRSSNASPTACRGQRSRTCSGSAGPRFNARPEHPSQARAASIDHAARSTARPRRHAGGRRGRPGRAAARDTSTGRRRRASPEQRPRAPVTAIELASRCPVIVPTGARGKSMTNGTRGRGQLLYPLVYIASLASWR